MSLEKFKLLCWKNFTLQKRHPIAALFEIGFPILVVLIFAFAKNQVDPQRIAQQEFTSFEPEKYRSCQYFDDSYSRLGVYSGGNLKLEDLVNSSVGKKSKWQVEVFGNLSSLDNFLTNENGTLGIEFQGNNDKSDKLPEKLVYAIRLPQKQTSGWLTDSLFLPSLTKASRSHADVPQSPPYDSSCFLAIQNDIERAFIAAVTGKSAPPTALHRFPYPPVMEDPFTVIAGGAFPMLFVLCLMLSAKNIIKNVTTERETQMKEAMKMMGLSSKLHWLAWYTKCLIMIEFSIVGIMVLVCTSWLFERPMFGKSNPILIWTFFNIYATGVITFCFLISVVFKKATTAGNVGIFLFFVTVLPYQYFSEKFNTLQYAFKILYILTLNSGMGQGMQSILIAENDDGVNFGNLFTRDIDSGISFGEIMLMMIFGAMIQILMTLYIEKVFTGSIGIPEPWYFPVQPIVKFLRKKMGYNSLQNQEAMLQERRVSHSDYEDEPLNLKAGIRISNLSKSFGKKPVVNKLNMNIFEDQITVLLGHNGAGKTTTMSMLTGMFPPSSGTAYLNGKDIRVEINEARQSLGLCPQHNILFDELTVGEHFIFFSRLKGINGKQEIANEVRHYVNLLDLNNKVNAQSHTLSGGMKRKLSIGIALCGNSKIVMCDEPTSGMDPSARRALWDLLIAEKKGRTILLTTHHMDEADVLGDRIAIMCEGQLRAVGSSFFLKKKFGTGYKLICVKEPGCSSGGILNVIQKFAPDCIIESEAQTEAIFNISEQHLPIFQDIFKELEDNSKSLNISSFGCNLTTLEEVFLKLGTETYHPPKTSGEIFNSAENVGSTVVLFDEFASSNLVTGVKLMQYQIYAMILKKFNYVRRNYRSFIWGVAITALLIFSAMKTPTFSITQAPPLSITLDSYHDTMTVLQYDDSLASIAHSYESFLGVKDSTERVTDDMQIFYLEKANESLALVNREYLIGATFKSSGIQAWFNGEPLHTMPLTLNNVNRALLKSSAGNQFDILLTNKPFVRKVAGTFTPPENSTVFIMLFIYLFLLMIYWPSLFIGFYVKERESRAKLLQFISGANRFIYWLTTFFFDYAIFFVVICGIVAGVGIYQKENLSTIEELGTLMLILSTYAFAMLPLVYMLSYLFSKHSTAEGMVQVFGILFALLYAVYAILKFTSEKKIYKLLAEFIYWFGMMLGPFSLVDTFYKYALLMFEPKATFKFLSFDEHGIGINVLMLIIGGFFFLGFCLLKDHMILEWIFYKIFASKQQLPKVTREVDCDVKRETERIQKMSENEIENGNLVLRGLSKSYGNNLAVNQLHLAVDGAECFGLLGINGAGKTTTFKMMTGDELISSGDAYIRGYSMRNQMHKVHTLIGYCPQFDALLLDLTGRETIKIFSLLRGIPRNEINEITTKLSNELGFHQHLDKKIKAFSGGNKRKLSTALALIGNPSLIFLDEPTTGMDPGAKRQLWNIINRTRNSGRSVVMTSHSMEECEALCTKLAIMVNGEFKCLGSTQHLKNKFSKGFILTVKAGREDPAITARVLETFPSAVLKEKYLDISTFHITASNLKWSEIFSAMAQMKQELEIADYALTQTSLENVFLFFTKSGLYQEFTDNPDGGDTYRSLV